MATVAFFRRAPTPLAACLVPGSTIRPVPRGSAGGGVWWAADGRGRRHLLGLRTLA